MGDSLEKSMVFVKVDTEYKQEGWLSLVMGKTLWIDASKDGWLQQIATRLGKASKLPPAALQAATPTTSSKSTTLDPNTSQQVSEILGLVKQMVLQFSELQTEVKSMREDLNSLRDQVRKV